MRTERFHGRHRSSSHFFEILEILFSAAKNRSEKPVYEIILERSLFLIKIGEDIGAVSEFKHLFGENIRTAALLEEHGQVMIYLLYLLVRDLVESIRGIGVDAEILKYGFHRDEP